MTQTVRLRDFDNAGFDRGAGRLKEAVWILLRSAFFMGLPYPADPLRRFLLRRFGATVGRGVVIKPEAKITFPWRLTLGDDVWLGEGCWILNLAPVHIGSNVCISQRAFICTGSHDWSKPAFDLIVRPVTIGDGAWLCANTFVAPGVSIGEQAVVAAGSVVTEDLPAGMICSGNPCKPVKPRNT